MRKFEVEKSGDGTIEIWWDRNVETMQQVEGNRLDVVVIDHAKKRWLIVDFSLPCHRNVTAKEKEKILKYSALAHQVRKLHRVSVYSWMSRCCEVRGRFERVGNSRCIG